MAYIIDDRARFLDPRKLLKLLEQERKADPDIYAGIIDALCHAAGWNAAALLETIGARIPKYAQGSDKDEWVQPG